MGNRKTFQRLVGFGVVFAMSLGLFPGNVGHFNRYTTEAAVKKSEIKLSKEADKAYKEVESLISEFFTAASVAYRLKCPTFPENNPSDIANTTPIPINL